LRLLRESGVAMKLLTRGRLNLLPEKVEDLEGLRKIVAAGQKMGGE
jgi:hypothetical protein